jgi:VIT1/CCC1 family predicted Fe2+/Mn2+ transporter
MNFYNIIRKGTNKDLEALKDSAIYDIATEKLAPIPYASQAKPLFLLSKYFSVAYHFLSYSIALIGIILYAFQIDSIIYQIVMVILAFLLLGIIEIAKGNSSTSVFASTARKEQPNQLFLAILVITTILLVQIPNFLI